MARLRFKQKAEITESASPRDRRLFLHWWEHSLTTQTPKSIHEATRAMFFAPMPFPLSAEVRAKPSRYLIEVRLSSAVLPGQYHDYDEHCLSLESMKSSVRPFTVIQERWSCPAEKVLDGSIARIPVSQTNDEFAVFALAECLVYDTHHKQRVGEVVRHPIDCLATPMLENAISGGMVIGFTSPMGGPTKKKRKKVRKPK